MHRVRQSLPYFERLGWEPTVIAVTPEQCEAPRDPWLVETVPKNVRVIRVSAIDIRKTRRLRVGNLDLRALFFIERAGRRLLKEEHFDLIYFSTTAFLVMGLGALWRRRFGIPYVLDIQDPWRTDYYKQPDAPLPPGGRLKHGFMQALAGLLEPSTVKQAAHVLVVSPAYPDLLRKRYPTLRKEIFTVLPFGAPNVDFDILTRKKEAHGVFNPDDGHIHWVYVGRAGGDMEFALRAFFIALQQARLAYPEALKKVCIHFVGTDYAAGSRARRWVEPIAEEYQVHDMISERPHRIPYAQALAALLDADAHIMPGSDDPSYTASKLYPYILARKPLLAIFHEQSSVHEVLGKTRAGQGIAFSHKDALEDVAAKITRSWFEGDAWAGLPATNWQAFEPYSAREMTRKQCEVFNRVIGHAYAKPHAGQP